MNWVCGISVVILSIANSNASTVIYQFAPVTSSGSSAGQIDVTFQDACPGSVLMTIAAPDRDDSEILSDLYFNFDPADSLTHLHFKDLDGVRARAATVTTGANAFQADDGYYDIHFDFDKPNNGECPDDGPMNYLIRGCGLNALDFAFLDSASPCGDTSGTNYALAQIQGVCGSNQWLAGTQTLNPVPEPASIGLLGLAIGGLWKVVRYKQRRRG